MASAYSLKGCSILVAEDDPLIALELADLFQSAGAQVISVANLAAAVLAIEHDGICAAVLDYRLGDDNVSALCRSLEKREIPFMFYSGYGDLQQSFAGHVIVQKPATGDILLDALAGLVSLPPTGGRHAQLSAGPTSPSEL